MNRVVPITTSQTESRIRGYRAAGDIELSEKEIEVIDKEGKRRAWVYWPGIARFLGIFTLTLFILQVTGNEDALPIRVYWPGIARFVVFVVVLLLLFKLFAPKALARLVQ